MQKKLTPKALILIALGVVFSIVLYKIAAILGGGLLFMDTVGTIFVAAFLGPIPGILTGVLTNLVNGVLSGPMEIPFLLVNAAVGAIVGLTAQKTKNYNILTAIIVGLVLAVVCPLIGTPIAVWLFGGLTGSGTDFIVLWLKSTGMKLIPSAFYARIVENLVDKVISSLLVFAVLKALPLSLLKDSILENLIKEKENKLG